jgi:hypothetical protein
MVSKKWKAQTTVLRSVSSCTVVSLRVRAQLGQWMHGVAWGHVPLSSIGRLSEIDIWERKEEMGVLLAPGRERERWVEREKEMEWEREKEREIEMERERERQRGEMEREDVEKEREIEGKQGEEKRRELAAREAQEENKRALVRAERLKLPRHAGIRKDKGGKE